MEDSGHSPDFFEGLENLLGEVPDVDIRRPAARKLNEFLKKRRGSGSNDNTVMDLGEGHGETYTNDIIGARDDEEAGKLRVYIRQAGEHKKLVVVVIAAGVVIGGISAIRHKKR